MVEEAADALCSGECPVSPLLASTRLEAEGDVSVFESFNAVGGDGNPTDVGGAVFDTLGTGAGRLTMRHPSLLPDLGRHVSEQTGGE